MFINMQIQRGYSSPQNNRRHPINMYPNANNIGQHNSTIISKLIVLHNRIEKLTGELSQKTKRENNIVERI